MGQALLQYLRGFDPTAQPPSIRRAYRRELVAACSFPVPLAMIEGAVVSVIAALLFEARPIELATILAAPMFANLTSGFWARLSRGRRKAPMLALIQCGVLATLGGIALLPTGRDGALWLVGLVVLARCLVAGSLTVQTTIWRANYPRAMRSRVTGRLMLINTVVFATAPVLAAVWLDRFLPSAPWLFRGVYVGAALVGIIAVASIAGLRVRRERSLIKGEITGYEPGTTTGISTPEELSVTASTTDHDGSMLAILRRDRLFRNYMVAQFLAGLANMAGNTAMIVFIVGLIETLPEDGWVGPYFVGILLTSAVVQALVALSIPFWASYLDKVHVARFRTRHGLLWIATQSAQFILAILTLPTTALLALALIPRMMQGLVFGGGKLAWQLGHHDFAGRNHAASYMGVHQTLTGVRGLVAPYLGVLLFTGWDRADWGGLTLPGFNGIGPWCFAITTALAVLAWLGFVRLAREIDARGGPSVED
ncbi:MAG: MFS transporter [Planctomycetota bacterium]